MLGDLQEGKFGVESFREGCVEFCNPLFFLVNQVCCGCGFKDDDSVVSFKIMGAERKVSVNWPVGFCSCCSSVVCYSDM